MNNKKSKFFHHLVYFIFIKLETPDTAGLKQGIFFTVKEKDLK
jgi:hypothetical protein